MQDSIGQAVVVQSLFSITVFFLTQPSEKITMRTMSVYACVRVRVRVRVCVRVCVCACACVFPATAPIMTGKGAYCSLEQLSYENISSLYPSFFIIFLTLTVSNTHTHTYYNMHSAVVLCAS